MKQRLKVLLAVVLIALITLCSALLVNHFAGRARVADLTDGSLYSLSAGTRSILGKLNQPVTLRLYYSRASAQEGPDGIRFWNSYFLYVRDLLDEYAARSNGMLKLEVIDPKTSSEEEEAAITGGLKRFDLGSNSFLFGLIASTELGKSATLPFFQPQRQAFVEYDVSKLISDLTRRQKLSVGVLSSLPALGDNYPPYMMMMLQQQGKTPKQAWGVFQAMRESYDVFEAKVKNGVFERTPDYLLVIHPKKLDRPALFAIDQFIVKGGKAAIFLDPFCISDQPQMPMYQQPEPGSSGSELNALLNKWGISMETKNIVTDPLLAVKVPLEQGRAPEPFPAFLELTEKNLDRKQVAVAELRGLQMLFAGDLVVKPAEGLKIEVLAKSTADGNLWSPEPYELSRPPRFAQLMKALKPENRGEKTLSCLITGTFKSNYPDGIEFIPQPENEQQQQNPMMMNPMMMGGMGFSGDGPAAAAPVAASAPAASGAKAGDAAAKPEEKKEPQPIKLAAVKEGAEPGTVFVTADVDMLTDQLAFRGGLGGQVESGDNAAFLLNIVDYLGGSTDLMSVRTRSDYLRPFTVIDEIEREAEKASAGKVEELNASISQMQRQLSELISSQGGKNTEIVQKSLLEKKRDLEAQVIRANRELRKLDEQKRASVAKLQNSLKWFNLLFAPTLVLLIALGIWIHRRTPKTC